MAPKTILLKGDPLQKEAYASAAITPGWLIKYSTTSGRVEKHATEGGDAMAMFAIENSLEGEEIGDDYSTADQCQFVHARPGDEIYAWLAQGENVSIGDPLCSHGDGTLKKHVPLDVTQSATGNIYVKAIVGYALEALNLSTSSEEATRIKIVVA